MTAPLRRLPPPALPAPAMPRANRRQRRASRARAGGIGYWELPQIDAARFTVRPKRGETIQQFVDRTGWARRGPAIICVEGDGDDVRPIMRKDWNRKIRAKDRICFLADYPLKGGGGGAAGSRSIGALVAMVALMAIANMLAPGIGGALAGALQFGSAGTWATIAKAVIIGAGAMMISHFLSPKTPKDSDPGTLYSANLSGNQVRPQQTIPVQYGRMKFTPDFSASAWQDFIDQEQYFHGLYTIGVGKYQIHEIGVAETPIWREDTGISPGFAGFQYEIVAPDQPVTLFPVNVVSSPNVTGQEFPDPYSPENVGPGGEVSGEIDWVGPFSLNPAGTSGQEIMLDLLFGGGCYTQFDAGRVNWAYQHVVFQIRYIDDAGVPIGGVNAPWITIIDQRLQFATTKPRRVTLRHILTAPGRVQIWGGVRIVQFRTNGTNVLSWVGARMYIAGGNSRPHVTQLGVRIKGDKQFSGYSQQSLYVIATRILPVWNGSDWVEQPTRSVMPAAFDAWRNTVYGGGQPTSRLDFTTLLAEGAAADARGEEFNYRFTSRISVLEAIETIFRTIRAKPRYIWDMLSIVRDQPRPLPSLMLTDHQILRDPGVEITYNLIDNESADGVIVQYLNDQIWKPADAPSRASITEMVNPTRVEIPGVTKRDQAVYLARHLELVNQKQRITATVPVTSEGKLVFYGDRIIVSSDIPRDWGQSLEMKSFDPVTRRVEFMSPANWAETGNHYIRARSRSGKPYPPVKIARAGSDMVGIIDGFDLTQVQEQVGITLIAWLQRQPGDEMVTCSFSQGQPEEFDGLVTGVRSMGDDRYTISLVEYVPEIYDAIGDPVPPLPETPPLYLPKVPGIIQSINANLNQVMATLELSASWAPDPGSERYHVEVSLTGFTDDAGQTMDDWRLVYNGPEAGFIQSGFPPNNLKGRVRGVRAKEGGDLYGAWQEFVVIAPAMDLSPHHLGYQIGYIDMDSPLFDATFTGPNRALSDAMIAQLGEVVDRKQLDFSVETEMASVRQEMTAITGDLGSMATFLQQLEAKSNAGTGTGTMRWVASSSTETGVLAAVELFVSASGADGSFSRAGFRVEARSDGTSNFVVEATKFQVQDPRTKRAVFGTNEDGLTLQGVTQIAGVLQSADRTIHGTPVWSLDCSTGREVIRDDS